MLIIVETKRNVHTFMSFDEVVTFLRENILTVEEKDNIAKKAISLLDTNNIAPDLIKYYRNIFESYLIPTLCSSS